MVGWLDQSPGMVVIGHDVHISEYTSVYNHAENLSYTKRKRRHPRDEDVYWLVMMSFRNEDSVLDTLLDVSEWLARGTPPKSV